MMPATLLSVCYAAAATDESPILSQRLDRFVHRPEILPVQPLGYVGSGRVDQSVRAVICLSVNFKRDYGLHRIPSSRVVPSTDSHASRRNDDCHSVSITADM